MMNKEHLHLHSYKAELNVTFHLIYFVVVTFRSGLLVYFVCGLRIALIGPRPESAILLRLTADPYHFKATTEAPRGCQNEIPNVTIKAEYCVII
jgi:hypothetical protein